MLEPGNRLVEGASTDEDRHRIGVVVLVEEAHPVCEALLGDGEGPARESEALVGFRPLLGDRLSPCLQADEPGPGLLEARAERDRAQPRSARAVRQRGVLVAQRLGALTELRRGACAARRRKLKGGENGDACSSYPCPKGSTWLSHGAES